MSETIDFGIDLGTTNSAIAKFFEGDVEVFEDPRSQGKKVLPSVVGFRRDKTLIGGKAQELLSKKGPHDAVGKFKRKMGTTESFRIDSIDQSKTPTELSAEVLKRLKEFIRTDESLNSAVITIPASFDTVQSNATKEAGHQAGIEQVVLLQEPIAASLAYANQSRRKSLDDGKWLVYDMGGGTFDVALMRIEGGEMKVIDHEGDNFLGGSDFDQLIVEEVIIPRLEELGTFSDLESEMKSAAGDYNDKYLGFLRKAERAKIELSAVSSAEIEIEDIEDEEGNELFDYLTITRSEFEDMIQPHVNRTIDMIQEMLVRSSLTPADLQFVLMVGGSTYIPFIRQRVGEVLDVPVNCEVDPTTAVSVGAAHYASTKPVMLDEEVEEEEENVDLEVRLAYHETSQEESELIAAKFEGNTDGLNYRITRRDGGFDTGLKPLEPKISEDLPLVEDSYNYFDLKVYDDQNNVVETDAEPIGIAQGKYGVAGQPLPDDISLERDDPNNEGSTFLDRIFEKNEILPLQRNMSVTVNKTVAEGSDDSYKIRVVEGPHHALPESNKTIGFLEIRGDMLNRDVVKGSDLDITLQYSESRDLTVRAEVRMTGQEFKEVFSPEEREVPVPELKEQTRSLSSRIEAEVEDAKNREDYEAAKELQSLQEEVEEVESRTSEMKEDDVTDDRYQLEDRKRKLAQQIDNATKDKHLQEARKDYEEAKEHCNQVIGAHGNDDERRLFENIVAKESIFLSSSDPSKIRRQTEEMQQIAYSILWRTPAFLQEMFNSLTSDVSRMNNQEQAKSLVEAGRYAVENRNWDRLSEINHSLIQLLPQGAEPEVGGRIGF